MEVLECSGGQGLPCVLQHHWAHPLTKGWAINKEFPVSGTIPAPASHSWELYPDSAASSTSAEVGREP